MPIFTQVNQQDFIENNWQKEPTLFRQSFSNLINIVDGNELAGLACADGVETRIIRGHDIDDEWTCQHGPFGEDDFTSLPEQDWTLLIQGVDQWDDEISAILDQFNFLPVWRLEDIMASYAPIGGNVGPHFDQYDVFLIQVSGSREWKIGQDCDNASELQDNKQVRVLSTFDCKETYTVDAGDMIYIPAGIAHWGTSLSDDCITFSVGFRAPSDKEIIVEAIEGLIERFELSDNDNSRYQDNPASIDQHPNKINQAVHAQLESVLTKLTPEILKQSINQAFGKLVTDPRYSPFDDEGEMTWTEAELIALFNHGTELVIHHSSNSRFAFSATQLFVNGEVYNSNEAFSQAICDRKIIKPTSTQQTNILLTLLNQQYIKV